MPGFPIPTPIFQGLDTNGLPVAGGLLYSYAAGSNTPLATYTTQALNVANANPTVLDASGRASVWIEDGIAYKFILKDSLGNTLWTEDSVSVPQIQAAPAAVNVPVGAILPYGAAAAPSGYLACDGSPVSRSTFAALFAVVGTAYGVGNGSTTFNVPDFRQRFPMGVAASGTGATLGATGGTIDHLHTGPSHTHTVAAHHHTSPTHTHSVPRDGWGSTLSTPGVTGRLQTGNAGGSGSDASEYMATTDTTSGANAAANTGDTALTTDAAGSGNTGTANPPFQTCYFVIKT